MNIRFSDEEKRIDTEDTLKLLLEGRSYSYIANELGRSVSYIRSITEKMIADGKISREEVRLKAEKRVNSYRERNKKGKRQEVEKRIQQNKEKIDKERSQILKLIKANKTPIEIAKILNMTDGKVLYHKNQLIKAGIISNDEVADREKSRILDIDNKKDKVLNLIIQGRFSEEQINKLVSYTNKYLELASKETISESAKQQLLLHSKETDGKVDKKLVYELTLIEMFKHEEIGDLFGLTRKDVGRIKSNLKPKELKKDNLKVKSKYSFNTQSTV